MFLTFWQKMTNSRYHYSDLNWFWDKGITCSGSQALICKCRFNNLHTYKTFFYKIFSGIKVMANWAWSWAGGLLFWIQGLSWDWCNSWRATMLWFVYEQFASHRRSELTGHCLKWHSACFPQMSGTKQLPNQITVPPPWVTGIPLAWLLTPTTLWWCDPLGVMSWLEGVRNVGTHDMIGRAGTNTVLPWTCSFR